MVMKTSLLDPATFIVYIGDGEDLMKKGEKNCAPASPKSVGYTKQAT